MINYGIPLSHLLVSHHDKNIANTINTGEILWLQLIRLLVSSKQATDLMHLFVSWLFVAAVYKLSRDDGMDGDGDKCWRWLRFLFFPLTIFLYICLFTYLVSSLISDNSWLLSSGLHICSLLKIANVANGRLSGFKLISSLSLSLSLSLTCSLNRRDYY